MSGQTVGHVRRDETSWLGSGRHCDDVMQKICLLTGHLKVNFRAICSILALVVIAGTLCDLVDRKILTREWFGCFGTSTEPTRLNVIFSSVDYRFIDFQSLEIGGYRTERKTYVRSDSGAGSRTPT